MNKIKPLHISYRKMAIYDRRNETTSSMQEAHCLRQQAPQSELDRIESKRRELVHGDSPKYHNNL